MSCLKIRHTGCRISSSLPFSEDHNLRILDSDGWSHEGGRVRGRTEWGPFWTMVCTRRDLSRRTVASEVGRRYSILNVVVTLTRTFGWEGGVYSERYWLLTSGPVVELTWEDSSVLGFDRSVRWASGGWESAILSIIYKEQNSPTQYSQ